MVKKTACLSVAMCLLHATADGVQYQWVDEKGVAHISDRPPVAVPRPSPPSTPAQAPADKIAARSYPIPNHGKLVLAVPESWRQEIRQPAGDLPPTIVLTPRRGDDFEVLITALWSPRHEPGFNNSQATKRIISENLTKMLPTAVERQVPIEEIRGKYGTGYYFIVTDRAPGPDGFPYAAKAGIGIGDLWLIVTVLTRSRDSEEMRQTLHALQGAAQTKN